MTMNTSTTTIGDLRPRNVRPCHLCGRASFVYHPDRQLFVCSGCYTPHDPEARYTGRLVHAVHQREMLEHYGLTPVKTGADCVLRLIGKRCKSWPDCPCQIDGGTGGSILDHTQLWKDKTGELVWTSEPYAFRQERLDDVLRDVFTPLGIKVQIGGYSPWFPEFTTLLMFRAVTPKATIRI